MSRVASSTLNTNTITSPLLGFCHKLPFTHCFSSSSCSLGTWRLIQRSMKDGANIAPDENWRFVSGKCVRNSKLLLKRCVQIKVTAVGFRSRFVSGPLLLQPSSVPIVQSRLFCWLLCALHATVKYCKDSSLGEPFKILQAARLFPLVFYFHSVLSESVLKDFKKQPQMICFWNIDFLDVTFVAFLTSFWRHSESAKCSTEYALEAGRHQFCAVKMQAY